MGCSARVVMVGFRVGWDNIRVAERVIIRRVWAW